MNPKQVVSQKSRINTWINALRVPFFTASIVPVALGGAIAWALEGAFNPFYFVLTLVEVVCLHAGANLANDYFDFKSGCDVITRELTPFNGGSRVLPDELLTPRSVYAASMIFFGIGILVGFYLALKLGWILLLLGVIGLLSGYLYSAPPIYLASRGIGELLVGLNFGPLVVLGTYYVQVQRFAFEPLVASLPAGFLIAAVLYINQFPDYDADKEVGKAHLVVRLGREKAVKGYVAIIAATYVSISLATLLKITPLSTLMGLVTIPKAKNAIAILKKYYDNTPKLIPANAATIQIHFFTGLLLALGYIIYGANL
ncbi:MAG: 1,4-dihydroxy-2-naphthoate octaprenyltransferase [Candidatus Hydrothermarchaeales archaeon]